MDMLQEKTTAFKPFESRGSRAEDCYFRMFKNQSLSMSSAGFPWIEIDLSCSSTGA
jgi:hypothetical protein